jgi:hypothetical protein
VPQATTLPQSPTTPTRARPDVQPHVIDAGSIPLTAQEVRGIRLLNDDLRRELQDAASRRGTVADRLREADPAARAGYEARLKVLDARILQIETDISANVAKLNRASPQALALAAERQQEIPPDVRRGLERISRDLVPLVAIFCVFVLGPMALAISRLIWRRGSAQTVRAPVADQMTMQRLEELQQSVDTIAIEVERISEGQRFVTRVLSDQPALAGGAAEPMRAAQKASIPSERR